MLLDPQRILLIGLPPEVMPIRTFKFFDAFDVNDFDLMAWDAESFVAEMQEKTGQPFQSNHHPFVYRRFKALYDEKIVSILNWIKQGHVLVIFPHLFKQTTEADDLGRFTKIDINSFPPFNLVSVTPVSTLSVNVTTEFHTQFCDFNDIFTSELMLLSGEGIVPLFRTSKGDRESSRLAGGAFRVGKGVIVFSPQPKAWDNPKSLEYFDALAKLPDMLGRPVDPLPEIKSPFQQAALWLSTLTVLIIVAIALSPFWAPQVEWLSPWSGKPPAAEQGYAILAARLTEIEKRPARSSIDVDAIKSAENALARRIDRLEAALARLQDPPRAPPSDVPAASTPPAASSSPITEPPVATAPAAASLHLSSQEIAEFLKRGDTLLRQGDVTSARLFYERAANAGDGQAALRLGATFDPAFRGWDVLRGVRGDPTEARLWYQRARDLGEAEASRRLKSLSERQ
jgi:hypothetical protein